ncbi:MAG: hypothetical protein SGPRY_007458 [Prymnesium sp.]
MEEWAADAVGFADQGIMSVVLLGLSDDSECERGTMLCLWCPARGRAAPSPYSVVAESMRAGKPKFRLTTDLSWPPEGSLRWGEGGWVKSVNAAIDRSACGLPTGWACSAEASQRRVKLWSLDCEAFYRVVGRRADQLWRNAAFTPDGSVVLDSRCCFGDAAAATKCARVSNFLAERVKQAIAQFDSLHTRSRPGLGKVDSGSRGDGVSRGIAVMIRHVHRTSTTG